MYTLATAISPRISPASPWCCRSVQPSPRTTGAPTERWLTRCNWHFQDNQALDRTVSVTNGFCLDRFQSVIFSQKHGLTIRWAPSEPKCVFTATHSSPKLLWEVNLFQKLSSLPGILSSYFHFKPLRCKISLELNSLFSVYRFYLSISGKRRLFFYNENIL